MCISKAIEVKWISNKSNSIDICIKKLVYPVFEKYKGVRKKRQEYESEYNRINNYKAKYSASHSK